LFLIIVSTNL